ncbi:mobilization protein, partial [Klebsiella pneumoniae]|nr:mobilization protein [Klebsiella pneumoniae]MDZ1998849.1 MbeB family mobilization protein [Klebsiella pneumoniae]
MNSLLTLAKDLEQKSKAQQQSTGEMLKAAFSEHEKSVRAELSESGKRISAAIRAHEQGMSAAMQSNRLSVMRMVGRTWLTITMVSGLLFASLSGVLWYQGSLIASNLAEIDRQNAALSKLNAKTWG